MSLLDLSARALAEAVRRGDATPQTVAAETLARAEARNPAINAICHLNPAFAAEAETVATRLAAGEALPLAGVPVLIKENIWVEGLRVALLVVLLYVFLVSIGTLGNSFKLFGGGFAV